MFIRLANVGLLWSEFVRFLKPPEAARSLLPCCMIIVEKHHAAAEVRDERPGRADVAQVPRPLPSGVTSMHCRGTKQKQLCTKARSLFCGHQSHPTAFWADLSCAVSAEQESVELQRSIDTADGAGFGFHSLTPFWNEHAMRRPKKSLISPLGSLTILRRQGRQSSEEEHIHLTTDHPSTQQPIHLCT